MAQSALALLERLSDQDLEFLAPGHGEVLRRNPEFIDAALDAPGVFERLTGDPDTLLHVSPYLLFTVLLRRAARELDRTRFTLEPAGVGQRVPVFDAVQVQALVADRQIAAYLVELLASFTRAYSGVLWRRTERGVRRRRFSELDLEALRDLAAQAEGPDRFLIERRIGDVALFQSGIFPDHAMRPRLHVPTIEELEVLGSAGYERASRHPLAETAGVAEVLTALAERFRMARKVLNYLTDRFLYPFRANWFPAT